MQLRSAVLHKLYNEHIFRKLIQKMHTHRSTKERKFWELSGKKMERRQTNSSTAYLRVRERCAYSTLSLPQHEKKKKRNFSRRNEKMKKRRRWGGGGRARRTIFNYAENALAEMATVLRKDATILIRLREKMRLHLCTVFIRLAIQ